MVRVMVEAQFEETANSVAQRLAALKCDPIAGMAALARDKKNPPELRGRMFAELAQYVAPKRRAIEHSTDLPTLEALLERLGDA